MQTEIRGKRTIPHRKTGIGFFRGWEQHAKLPLFEKNPARVLFGKPIEKGKADSCQGGSAHGPAGALMRSVEIINVE